MFYLSLYYQADDDTYMIVDNLRHMLMGYNTSEPHYLGAHVMHEDFEPHGIIHGGPGSVLSRGALELFVLQVSLKIFQF